MNPQVFIIAPLDLENTVDQVESLQKILELASNNKIVLVPIKMEETINQVYYRDSRLDKFKGFEYKGETDDQRAITSFIAQCFSGIRTIVADFDQIFVISSECYEKQARILERLIKGQQLMSQTTYSQSFNDVVQFFEKDRNEYRQMFEMLKRAGENPDSEVRFGGVINPKYQDIAEEQGVVLDESYFKGKKIIEI